LRTECVIGPRRSVIGQSGKAHEFGGRYLKNVYQKRPFMKPALQANLSRLPKLWQASIS
jgi:hypothetical protein